MTFTIKWETMTGTIKRTKIRAADLQAACWELCQSHKVGNILEACDCCRVRWL